MDAYFDIFSGISGNMILGALVDAGLSLEDLKKELSKLKLDDEYEIISKKVLKNGISGTYVNVQLKENHHGDDHDHHHHQHNHHHHRSLSDIYEIIDRSDLDDDVKIKSKEIFLRLAKAEAKMHGVGIEEVHFHEVGAVDAIVDIVGSVVGLKLLGVERIKASPVHVGRGFVKSAHGKVPVPAPATMELLEGVPVYSIGIEAELTTPTGAAIITTLAEEFGPRPYMLITKTAYGAGTRDLEIPNLLRINFGRFLESNLNSDFVNIIETNIDDMNPEFYDAIIEKLFRAGALDVYLIPVQMKKNRPGSLLTILCSDEKTEKIVNTVLKETTTLGLRILRKVQRYFLKREIKEVETEWGKVRVKIAKKGDEIINVAPEYEDCKRISIENDVPIKEVYNRILSAFYKD
ncbi:MAG: pyridinium-3,5-bisthiocarboxylic acid mononucleotide nickel chelatase [Thermotogaceae bacterium]|nr:pyridinium-3,5-bisthiocarboxylic acid mononucleotide nickel chelatase [Thermotogaceae bacterium]